MLINPTISVVVVTFCRPDHLRALLKNLCSQTYMPTEIIVVDNGAVRGPHTREVCDSFDSFKIKYIPNPCNSLPAGRNLGVKHCKGELISLIDDDVRIPNHYYEKMLAVFREFSNAVGVQGYIVQEPRSRWRELIYRIFGLYHLKANDCRVLPSVSTTYPSQLTSVIHCQWISGSNQLYKRSALEEIKWDESLIKYADGEDLDHSYRVFKRYPDGLFITPHATVIHDESATGRAVGFEILSMREVYGWYLFNKLFVASPVNLLAYGWSRFGKLIISTLAFILSRRRSAHQELFGLISAYWLVLRNLRKFRNGNLDSFNSTIR